MFYLNLERALRLRGVVAHQHSYLVKNGFVPATANNLLKFSARTIKLDHLEKLCLMLNCAPSDLIEWHPDEGQNVPETHALNALKRKSKDLSQMLREVPLEKFEQIESLLNELNNQPQ